MADYNTYRAAQGVGQAITADRARQQEEMERLRRDSVAPPVQPVEPAPTPVPPAR